MSSENETPKIQDKKGVIRKVGESARRALFFVVVLISRPTLSQIVPDVVGEERLKAWCWCPCFGFILGHFYITWLNRIWWDTPTS